MQTFENDKLCRNCARILPCFSQFQSVIDIDSREFAQNILLWPAYKLTDACATRIVFSYSRTALSYTESATLWFLEQATPEFISPDQSASTSVRWHTLSAASSTACLPAVCSKSRWTEEEYAGRLVQHGTYYWQCTNDECWISPGSVALLLRCGWNFYIRFVGNFIVFSTVEEFWKSIGILQSHCQNSTPPFFWDRIVSFSRH